MIDGNTNALMVQEDQLELINKKKEMLRKQTGAGTSGVNSKSASQVVSPLMGNSREQSVIIDKE